MSRGIRRMPIGRYVYDRRLVSGGRVSVRRKCGGHRVFRGCRGCRIRRVSSDWRAAHHAKAWQVFHSSSARDTPSSARRCGPPQPAGHEWETKSGAKIVARQRHSRHPQRRRPQQRRRSRRGPAPVRWHRQPPDRGRLTDARQTAQARRQSPRRTLTPPQPARPRPPRAAPAAAAAAAALAALLAFCKAILIGVSISCPITPMRCQTRYSPFQWRSTLAR